MQQKRSKMINKKQWVRYQFHEQVDFTMREKNLSKIKNHERGKRFIVIKNIFARVWLFDFKKTKTEEKPKICFQFAFAQLKTNFAQFRDLKKNNNNYIFVLTSVR